MTDLINPRETAQNSESVPFRENFGLAADTSIVKGGMVGLDNAAHVVKASAVACVTVMGAARFGVDNSTPPTGEAKNATGLGGTAGEGSLQIDYGVNRWDNSATNAITAAMVPCAAYVEDDHTVASVGTKIAGLCVGVGDEKGGGDKQVAVLQGPHGIAAATALASGGASGIVHGNVDLPLATIQGETSGTPFNIGAALPANARLLRSQVNCVAPITGGTLSAVKAKLQGTGTAGELVGGAGGVDVFAGAAVFTDVASGTDLDVDRGTQQLKMTLTATGDTLAHATAGHLSVDIFYAIVA